MIIFLLMFFSHFVVSDSLWPHGLKRARLPSPPSPGACSNSCPLSQWCHPTSVQPSSLLLSPSPTAFNLSSTGHFLMSRLSASCGQNTGATALASILPMSIRDWFPFRIDWFDLLAVQGTLKSLLQHHRTKASIIWCSAFFIVQLSYPYMTTGKYHRFDYMDLCWQSDVTAFQYAVLICHWSLRKASLTLLAILWNSAFRLVYLSFFPWPLASPFFSYF